MKLFKIAQSGKAVKIRVVINKGEFDTRILEHIGGAKCGDKIGGTSLDEELLREILDMDIDGYGKMFTVTKSSKTAEGQMEEQQSTPSNVNLNLTNPSPSGKQPAQKGKIVNENTPTGKQKLTQGFGV